MALIERDHDRLSIVRQCELAAISRSSLVYTPTDESAANERLMRVIDVQYLATPWYGSRQMARHLRRRGEAVNHKRVRRLMRLMGMAGIGPHTAQNLNTIARASRLSVFAARCPDYARRPGLVCGCSAPRGAIETCRGERPLPADCRSSRRETEGSPIPEMRESGGKQP